MTGAGAGPDPGSPGAGARERRERRASLALLPWGDVLELFLDEIGVTLETFRTRMTGGWLFGYVEALASAGIETVILCFSARVDRPRRERHEPTGARLVILPASGLYRRMRHGVLATPPRRLAAELRRQRCGAILCQEYEDPRFDWSVLVGSCTGLPVFATFQGGDFRRHRWEGLIRPLSVTAAAGLVIGPSREAERVRRRYGVPEHKLARIFNPVAPLGAAAGGSGAARRGSSRARVRRRVREELAVPPETTLVVWHGRVDIRVKGLDLLLEAWRRVRREGTQARLLLIGTGADAPALRDWLAAEGGGRRIGVLRVDEYVLDRDRLADYVRSADLAVLSSRREGFPVAPVEAMAEGLPVVVTDVPGARDILPEGARSGGLVVPVGDPGALASAIRSLIDDPDRRRALGERARRRAEAAFSPAAVGRQLADFLSARGFRPAGLAPVESGLPPLPSRSGREAGGVSNRPV